TPWIYPKPPSRRPNAVSQATYQSHRLRLGRVSETGRLYLITAVTQDREPVFSDLNNARILVNTLRMEALQNGVQTWCYLVCRLLLEKKNLSPQQDHRPPHAKNPHRTVRTKSPSVGKLRD